MSKNPPPDNEFDMKLGAVGGKQHHPSLDNSSYTGHNKHHLAHVWYSWQKFQGTLKHVVESEWNHKKSDVTGYIAQFFELFEFISIKLLIISALPMLIYLSVFKSYLFLKEVFHLPERPHLVLPVIERYLFHCLPHQVLSRRNNAALDIMAALPYLIHFILPVLFIGYLTIMRRARSVPTIYQYLWCLGWTNVVAVCMQFLLPTAPPWFNDSAVFDEIDGSIISEAKNEAAFQRIDAMLGVLWFHGIYGQSPLKYGSFPSLHVAWPTVVLLHGHITTTIGLIHVLWITWAALYSTHHYLIDILGGISVVIIVKLSMIHIWEPFSQKKRSKEGTTHHRYQRLSSCSKTV